MSFIKEIHLKKFDHRRPTFLGYDTDRSATSIATMGLSRTVSENKRRLKSKIAKFSQHSVFNATDEGVPLGIL